MEGLTDDFKKGILYSEWGGKLLEAFSKCVISNYKKIQKQMEREMKNGVWKCKIEIRK